VGGHVDPMSAIASDVLGNIAGKKIAVFGLGRSGLAVANVALNRGALVWATDSRAASQVSAEVTALGTQQGVTLVLGGHEPKAFRDIHLCVVSPGVPPLPLFDEFESRGVPVISELEFGLHWVKAPIAVIGGTNGKSTTTTLTGAMLTADGRRVFVGGNLGAPLCEAVGSEWDSIVLEVSSFQLERSPSLKPQASVLLNITEDHLDRYPTFEDYARAKGNAFVNQTSDDVAIVPVDDDVCRKQALRGRGRLYTFGNESAGKAVDYFVTGLRAVERRSGFSLDLSQVNLHGQHNYHNLLAAFAAARALGADDQMIENGAKGFVPLPHRMQKVRTLDGISYYDDSKATNVGAAVTAIRGLSEPWSVVIAGGRDKQGSYVPFVRALREKARAVVLIGEATPIIAQAVGDAVPVHRANSMEEAVEISQRLAKYGDAVLLSPACSSFDMFKSYAHRGDVFADVVRRLVKRTVIS
jgi:UDP-N-acetylmuramoylalanine--D-glutamate ligase